MASTLTADEHKLKGNEYFKAKDYQDAIQEYSKAIVKTPSGTGINALKTMHSEKKLNWN